MSKHIAKAQTVEVDGATCRIDSAARWVATEGVTWTQVMLTGCADARLEGLTICWDWSQGSVRPATKRERVEHITHDPGLVASHVEARVLRASEEG